MPFVADFYEFLWLYLGVLTAVGALLLARSMRTGAADGLSVRERRYTIAGVLVLGEGSAAFLAWYRFGLGIRNPMCPTGGPTDTVLEVLGYAVMVGFLAWLWVGGGAKALSRLAPVLVGHAYTARQVRRTLSSGVVVLFGVSLPLERWQPELPPAVCASPDPVPNPVDELRWHLRRQA